MKIVSILCIAALVLGMATLAYAVESKRTAQILSIDGQAEVKLAGDSDWSPAQVGMVLKEGDALKTAAGSLLMLNVDGKGQTATVEVKERSQLLLSEMLADTSAGTSKTLLDLAM